MNSRHFLGSFVVASLLGGCGGTTPTPAGDAGAADVAPSAVDGGTTLAATFRTPVAPAFSTTTSAARTIHVAITGEGEAQNGFDYTASPPMGERVVVDGWQLRFDRVIATVANVRLNRPGTSPSDRTVVGDAVYTSPAAFAVNVARMGTLTGTDGDTSIPLMVIPAGTSGPLDPTVRYAFSYDLVSARASATNVNLDGGDVTAYQEMLTRGWTWLFEGTATYQGAAPAAGSAFASFPTTVRFRFGFGAEARYINCDNPDNGGDDLPGVAPNASRAVTAQITLHVDHLLWGALGVEDPPLRFDHIAARARGAGTMGEVTLDDLMGVVPTNLRDRMNRAVADRGAQTMGYTARNPNALSFDLGGNTGITDLRDFLAFSQRASGHLNGEGLCAVRPLGALRY